MSKLTTERLEQYAHDKHMCNINDEIRDMARQLLAYEQAGKETKIYQYQSCLFNDENGETDWYWDDCDKGFFEQYDPAHRRIVYAAPVLPKQPELPQGFTYESGILTANFGNGDVLISDTHWPESGHAGISFAPVPQPKRPNLSDYTDLLGGSKTEEIGTLFIVKSNSAESLIAIRNKLDIAISALSPAPAQPVIPEHREYISFDTLMAAVSEVTGAKSEFDATPEKCYQAVPL